MQRQIKYLWTRTVKSILIEIVNFRGDHLRHNVWAKYKLKKKIVFFFNYRECLVFLKLCATVAWQTAYFDDPCCRSVCNVLSSVITHAASEGALRASEVALRA